MKLNPVAQLQSEFYSCKASAKDNHAGRFRNRNRSKTCIESHRRRPVVNAVGAIRAWDRGAFHDAAGRNDHAIVVHTDARPQAERSVDEFDRFAFDVVCADLGERNTKIDAQTFGLSLIKAGPNRQPRLAAHERHIHFAVPGAHRS